MSASGETLQITVFFHTCSMVLIGLLADNLYTGPCATHLWSPVFFRCRPMPAAHVDLILALATGTDAAEKAARRG